MAAIELVMMVKKGYYSERIEKIYRIFGSKHFSYAQLKKKIPEFKAGYLRAMHNSRVIKPVDTSKHKGVKWMFTTDALTIMNG